jgi:hypothetical protein
VNKCLNVLLDPGTFLSWDDGARESVSTGTGTVAGHRAAIVAPVAGGGAVRSRTR